MSGAWEFANNHPVITLVIVWLLVTLIGRTWRMVMVSLRGWPPAHLDADGDWRPETSDEAP